MSSVTVTIAEAIKTARLHDAGHNIDLARIELNFAHQNAQKSIEEAPRQLRDCDAKSKAGDERYVLIKADLMNDIKRTILAEREVIKSKKLSAMMTEFEYEMLKARFEITRNDGPFQQELESFVRHDW